MSNQRQAPRDKFNHYARFWLGGMILEVVWLSYVYKSMKCGQVASISERCLRDNTLFFPFVIRCKSDNGQLWSHYGWKALDMSILRYAVCCREDERYPWKTAFAEKTLWMPLLWHDLRLELWSSKTYQNSHRWPPLPVYILRWSFQPPIHFTTTSENAYPGTPLSVWRMWTNI